MFPPIRIFWSEEALNRVKKPLWVITISLLNQESVWLKIKWNYLPYVQNSHINLFLENNRYTYLHFV